MDCKKEKKLHVSMARLFIVCKTTFLKLLFFPKVFYKVGYLVC